MDNRQIWKLAEELNVFQIILLMADFDPIDFEGDHFERWDKGVRDETGAYRVVIQNAVIAKKIEANIAIYEGNYDGEINWEGTRISVSSLTEWLNFKKFGNCFFTDETNAIPGFADKSGDYYAPKLAAAVDAWTEVTANLELLKNKSPKQALDKWLREHALEYELTLESGDPNKQGIAEISKIANWKPTGGVSPTSAPTKPEIRVLRPTKAGGRQLRAKPSTRSAKPAIRTPAIDDDIPF